MKNDRKKAGLSGLTVVEVSHGIEGAYCARLLADAGADVIKVERTDRSDVARRLGPFPDGVPDENASGLFHYLNANKRSLSLNLYSEAGAAVLDRLIDKADILVSDFAPSELELLSLTYQTRRDRNPDLIACAITAFGLFGPYRERTADDIVVLSLGGVTAATPGFPDYVVSRQQEGPLRAAAYTAGTVSGAAASVAILTALFARLGDGKGRQIDISQHEAVASTMIRDIASYSYAGMVSGRRTEEEQSGTAYAPNVYLPCKDGMVVIVTASEESWKKLVELMGFPGWAGRDEFCDTKSRALNINALLSNLVDWTTTMSGAEITRITQSNGLPCAHVLRIPELVKSDHARDRGIFIEVLVGDRTCRMPAPPFRIDGVFGEKRVGAPRRGEHNADILCGLLGYEKADLATLSAIGAV
jgi:crotonobetainyl-CoA:carnitine CoA-transferase CaiB-like acyl-CoA transferase